jgi:hypothetical protein
MVRRAGRNSLDRWYWLFEMTKTIRLIVIVKLPDIRVKLVSLAVEMRGERLLGMVNMMAFGGASQGVKTAEVFSSEFGIGDVTIDALGSVVENGGGSTVAESPRAI